jgi:hypothetical protein
MEVLADICPSGTLLDIELIKNVINADTKVIYESHFNVFHIDGNLNNCKFNNLKTVCANCQRSLHLEGIRWKQGDLVPDF